MKNNNNKVIDEEVREQILAIRATGAVNMLDINGVQRIAFEKDFYELVCLIEEEREKYIDFIFHGNKSINTEI